MSTPEAIKAYIKSKAELLEGTVFLAEKVETQEEYECYKNSAAPSFRGTISASLLFTLITSLSKISPSP
jgi:c-di-GMP-related signal transduction protein